MMKFMKDIRKKFYIAVFILIYILLSSFQCGNKLRRLDRAILYLKNNTKETIRIDLLRYDKFEVLKPNDSIIYNNYYLKTTKSRKMIFKHFSDSLNKASDLIIYKYENNDLVLLKKINILDNKEDRTYFFNEKIWKQNQDEVEYLDEVEKAITYSWTLDLSPNLLSK